MTWKKNWFSRILWVCQLVVAALFLTGVSGIFLDKYKIVETYEILPGYNRLIWHGIICVLCFIVSLLVFLMVRLIVGRTGNLHLSHSIKISWEILLLVGLFSGGILYRITSFPTTLESNPYFELAAVNSTQMPATMAHGALYMYILLLHGLFLVLGNNLLAGIILQIVLQFVAVAIVYFAIRKIAGVLPALWTFGFFMLAPFFVKTSLIYTPENLYFLLFSIVLLLFSSVLKSIKNAETLKWYHYIGGFLFGITVSFMLYLDAVGCTLLVIVFSVFGIYRQEKIKNVLSIFLLILLGCVLGLLGVFAADSFISGSDLVAIAGVWEWLYIPENVESLLQLYQEILTKLSDNLIVSVLVFAGMAWGIYGYFTEKRKESQGLWILMTLSGIALSYLCPASGNMDRSFLGVFGMIVLAGKGLQLAVSNKRDEVEETVLDENEAAEIVAEETVIEETVNEENVIGETVTEDVVSKEVVDENVPIEEPVPVKEIKFIENPLPLPKKHVKKTMDYGYDFPEEQLYFDIEISEDDDFDF